MLPLAHYHDLLTVWPQLAAACCITYVEPPDAAGFLARVGAAATPAGEMSFAEALELAVRPSVPMQLTLVDITAGWVVAAEPYGFQGSRPEVLRAVSANGRSVGVSWNVNSRCWLPAPIGCTPRLPGRDPLLTASILVPLP